MIGVIATLRVKDDQTEAFERIFTEIAAAVRRSEEGNFVFQLTRSRTEPNTYKAMEIYRDEAALEAHRASDHARTLGKQLGPTLAGRPEVEYLDSVG